MKPGIVGESNPFGGDDYYALYDEPEGCTGDRLCRMVMGLRSETYRTSFERRNLLRGDRWSAPRAREAGRKLVEELTGERVWILLGRKVSEAFNLPYASPWTKPPGVFTLTEGASGVRYFMDRSCSLVVLPHPSGLNRMWADRTLAGRCRYLLQSVLPEIPFGEIYIREALKDFNQQEHQ